ncbi:MAG: endonuclease/exonuclease/phosphatase family protein [Alphaproteobacteria bacterium]|nr:endonuclease/exonuclease/phosphatase family protein [Alphaproteobacteria bacterium]MCB9692715.1 endonuclease/exonuclease/phosphatase family protein [Alphaproteobacteria bacterium]
MRLLPPLLLLTGCMPLAENWKGSVDFPVLRAEADAYATPDPETVRVVTWNIKYGWGRNDIFFDGWGDLTEIPQEEVLRVLDAQIALLEEIDADIVMTQETDHDSKRSAYVDEVQYILDNTDFNFAAYVPIWDAEYVAQSGMGPTEMGQVVFSRWPITLNTRIDQPVSKSDPGYVRYFAPRRAIQHVQIDLGGTEPLTVLNVHPTAYSLDGTKQQHLAQIFDVAQGVEGDIVVGGDFNVIPPGSVNADRFDDVVDAGTIGVTEVTYTEEEMAALEPFYEAYTPVISQEAYRLPPVQLDPNYDQYYDRGSTCRDRPDDQRRFFSHSLAKDVFWNQKLDYLFTSLTWSGGTVLQCPGDGGIRSEPMLLSDHAPVYGDLVRR